MPARAPSRAAPAAPSSTTTAAPSGKPRSLGSTAALVLVIVAAAHAGLYLLLTHEARAAVRTLVREHGSEALEHAQRPEEAPQPGTPAYGAWRREVERFDAAEALGRHRRHIALLRNGFLASFLVQAAITLWVLLKLLLRRRRQLQPSLPVRR